MGFRLPRALWPHAAPTWNDTRDGFAGECVAPFRERVLQGEVSDGNAYALGGVAGHAGLFATAPQLHGIVHQLLFAGSSEAAMPPALNPALAHPPAIVPLGGAPLGLVPFARLGVNATTVRTFTRVGNTSISSRALGWDTLATPHGEGRLCSNMSTRTFTHTGYTGGLICADPEAPPTPYSKGRSGLISILLTNRVYPRADDHSEHEIHVARIQFNEAVLAAVRSMA